MKYIKSKEDYLINEKIEISWKELIIGLGIIYGINHYFGEERLPRMSGKEIDKTISDINNAPSKEEDVFIKKIREDLISDIETTNNLDSIRKNKVISVIKSIKFVCVDTRTMQIIGQDKGTMACYFRHFNEKMQQVSAIIVDRKRLSSLGASSIIIHELRHLVDDVLGGESFDSENYSEFINIVDILDKDIVLGNPVGKKRLRQKIDFYSRNLVELAIGGKIEDIKSEKGKKEVKEVEDQFKNNFLVMFDDKEDTKYLTSPAEVYVRFHGLKRWMIKNGYLKDMNDLITQEKIIQVLGDKSIIREHGAYDLDFIEFLFYLDVDFTGKEPHDLKKVNSIVANYTDYLNKPNV
jgi:hypothetical protein